MKSKRVRKGPAPAGAGPPRRKGSTRTPPPLSLVTGACGFIGTHMAEVLCQAGHRVRGTDLAECFRGDDPVRGRFPELLKGLGVDCVPSDMTRPETLVAPLEGVDYVFHIAAVFSYTAPWELLRGVNVEGTRELCNLILEKKRVRKLLLWGAGGVYGFPPAEFLPVREEDPKSPPNAYLKSKHEQEQLVMALGRTRGLRYSIVRPTGVYGPRCVYGMGQVMLPAIRNPVVAVPRNFRTRVPLVHVRDVCEAALFLAQNELADGEAYNVNDDTQMTVVAFMKALAELQEKRFLRLPPVPVAPLKALLLCAAFLEGKLARYVTHSSPKLEPDTIRFLGRDIAYSNQKLKDLGYRFHYPDALPGLRETIDWYRQAGWA
jgi:nucleoside-diphosphate-sugar epimerase